MDSNIDNTNSNVSNTSMRDFMPSEEEISDTNQEVSEGGNNQGSTASVQDTDQTSEQTQKEETFTGNFDPNKLPPELQVAYKQMQADYTRKTQELAEARKFYEAYSQYAPLLSYIAENPQIVEAYLSGEGVEKPAQEQDEVVYPDDPVEFAKVVKEEAKKEALQEFLNYYQQQRDLEMKEASMVADADEASKVDPRLETDEEFADQVVALISLDKDYLAGKKTAVEATRQAIAKLDGFLSKRLEAEKQRLSELAKQKRSPLVAGSPMPTEGQTSQPRTMREAAAEFLK